MAPVAANTETKGFVLELQVTRSDLFSIASLRVSRLCFALLLVNIRNINLEASIEGKSHLEALNNSQAMVHNVRIVLIATSFVLEVWGSEATPC